MQEVDNLLLLRLQSMPFKQISMFSCQTRLEEKGVGRLCCLKNSCAVPPSPAPRSLICAPSQLMGVVGVVVVIITAIPILTVGMLPMLGLCYYFANRYLQVN